MIAEGLFSVFWILLFVWRDKDQLKLIQIDPDISLVVFIIMATGTWLPGHGYRDMATGTWLPGHGHILYQYYMSEAGIDCTVWRLHGAVVLQVFLTSLCITTSAQLYCIALLIIQIQSLLVSYRSMYDQ